MTRLTIIATLLVFPVLAADELDVSVVTLEGEEQVLKLAGFHGDTFNFGKKSFASRDIAEIRISEKTTLPASNQPFVYLRNGDVLRGWILSGDDTRMKLKSEMLGEIQIENKFVQALVFPGENGVLPGGIDNLVKGPPPKEDVLILPKGDTASGFFEKLTERELSFNSGGQSKVHPFDKIAGLRLAALEELKAPAGAQATFLLADSSRISGKLISINDGRVAFEAVNGQKWEVAADAVKSIGFSGGKMSYLADLMPKTADEKPYAGGMPLVFGWRKDLSDTGKKLTVGGRSYERGLGVHSYSRLVFSLDGKYAKFLCVAGLDAIAPESAVCAWQVNIDGKTAASGIAKPADAPAAIKLDVNGAKELELICDYGPDEDDAGDHFDWANARLIKP